MTRLDPLLGHAQDALSSAKTADDESRLLLASVPAREARYVAGALRKVVWRATRTADRLEARAEDAEAARA